MVNCGYDDCSNEGTMYCDECINNPCDNRDDWYDPIEETEDDYNGN